MKSRLLNSLEDGRKDQVKGEFQSSYHLRERVRELLERDIDTIHRSMRDEENYETPSWPYKQAEKIGEVKALKKN